MTRSFLAGVPQYVSFRARLISEPRSQRSSRYGPVPLTAETIGWSCPPPGLDVRGEPARVVDGECRGGDLRQERDVRRAQLEDDRGRVVGRDPLELAGIGRMSRRRAAWPGRTGRRRRPGRPSARNGRAARDGRGGRRRRDRPQGRARAGRSRRTPSRHRVDGDHARRDGPTDGSRAAACVVLTRLAKLPSS